VLNGKIENVQKDNGSEFHRHFDAACETISLTHYLSRVKTPKDNAVNERFNRTLQEEFVGMGHMIPDITCMENTEPQTSTSLSLSTFTLMADYELPLQEAITAGRYSWCDPKITKYHFRHPETAKVKRQVALVEFGMPIDTKEVLGKLNRLSLHPARLFDLLAFGATYLDVQLRTSNRGTWFDIIRSYRSGCCLAWWIWY
jgi:transposase InsO family protein